MAKVLDNTNLGYLISKIKAAFWPKSDVIQIDIDSTPTSNSDNLVKSGGVKLALDAKQDEITSTNKLDYSLIDNTPTIPAAVTESTVSGWGFTKNAAPGTLKTDNTTAQTASASESLTGTINLHKISKTGNFSDLLGTEWVMTCDNSHVLIAVCGDGITSIMGDSDGLLYALGSGNADGNEDYILATTDQIPTESTVSGWGFTKNAAPGTLITNATTAQTASSGQAMSGNITLHKVAKTGTYSDLIGTPTIPTVNNATLTIQKNGTTVNTFTANASSNVTANIQVNEVPSYSSSNNGQILSVVNGSLTWITPAQIYSGSATPSNSTGNNGDIYVQS